MQFLQRKWRYNAVSSKKMEYDAVSSQKMEMKCRHFNENGYRTQFLQRKWR